MEKPPEKIELELAQIFANKTVPRIVERDGSTGDVVEVLIHNGQIVTRVEGADTSVKYITKSEDSSTT